MSLKDSPKYITREIVLESQGYDPEKCVMVDLGVPLGTYVVLAEDVEELREVFEKMADRAYEIGKKHN